jgi:hypothetical protein
MKKQFYCVNAEFYDSGKVLACITSSTKRGKSQYRQVPGMSVFKMWWVNESYANQLLKNIRDGSTSLIDILTIWSDWKDWENGTFFKGEAA